MAEFQLNYEQITAAARQVISREVARCQSEFAMDQNYAHAAEHQHLAGGALMLWTELTMGRQREDERLHLTGMVQAIGVPLAQR